MLRNRTVFIKALVEKSLRDADRDVDLSYDT